MEIIKTKRLVLALAEIIELPEFEPIEKECKAYFSFDPFCEKNPDWTMKECILKEDIPFDGKKENYYFYGIRYDKILIGFIDYYLEYQRKGIAYISSVFINAAYRKMGIGHEVIDAVFEKFEQIGITEIRLHCSLRNVIGLRFWINRGFNQIVSVDCNENLFPNNCGGIELKKTLNG